LHPDYVSPLDAYDSPKYMLDIHDPYAESRRRHGGAHASCLWAA